MKKSITTLTVFTLLAGAVVCIQSCAHVSDGVGAVSDAAVKIAPGNKDVQQAAQIAKLGADIAFNEIGPFQKFQLGYEISAQLIGTYPVLPQTHPLTRYLKMVGATAALASKSPYQYRPYTFIVLDAKEINAFAAPGGFIFMTTGMIQFLQDEDELAAILGHEIAHIELDHGIKSVGREKILRLFSLIAKVAIEKKTSGGGQTEQMLAVLMNEVMNLLMGKIRQGYSVDIEGEADRRGAEICLELGYNPYALPQLLERFQKVTGTYGGANYPKERAADIQKHLTTLTTSKTVNPNSARRERFLMAKGFLGN